VDGLSGSMRYSNLILSDMAIVWIDFAQQECDHNIDLDLVNFTYPYFTPCFILQCNARISLAHAKEGKIIFKLNRDPTEDSNEWILVN
jgi:hypothetical protein